MGPRARGSRRTSRCPGAMSSSRRIAQEGERQRLKAEAERVKPAGMGLIVRTAAEGRSGEDFLEDVRELTALWEQIVGRVRAGRAPCCVHRDEDLITRTLRDLLTGDVDRIVLADAGEAERVRDALRVFAPALSERVDCYAGGLPLFDAYRIESRLEKALQKKVWLRNGGYLYIEATEALTVIDVNTGKFVGSRDLQDTVFRLNCEAAREIARQVRLRDIGGIIVIDFIDMQSEENRQKLVEVLREAFRRDRNKVNVAGLTSLGLVEMTRKRMRTPLSAGLQRACPCCGGTGRVLLVGDHNCMELKGFIGRCRFFVGARTHATIAAYSSCVPTLAAGYSVKSLEYRTVPSGFKAVSRMAMSFMPVSSAICARSEEKVEA